MPNRKSRNVSFLLTLFLGPLGLLYASPMGAIILMVVAVVALPVWGAAGIVGCWLMAIAVGDHAAHQSEQRYQEWTKIVGGRVSS